MRSNTSPWVRTFWLVTLAPAAWDGLFILNFQFVPGSPAPPCRKAADADDSSTFSGLVDGLYLLNFLFVPGNPPPPPPFPQCGSDPTADGLDCATPLASCP